MMQIFEKQSSEYPHLQTVDIIIPAHNARQTIQKTINSTLKQKLPPGWHKNVVIVDDGSSDDTGGYCKEIFKREVQVISHKCNRGRSASRNTGWRSGSGVYIVFMDADCEWDNTYALDAHLKTLKEEVDVSVGPIMARNQNFWAEYQNHLQKRREQDFKSGNLVAFTSANLATKRSMLETTDGFDEGYKHYGFEDRDFLLRLISFGANVSFTPGASVIHVPDSSLATVCRKMTEAAQYSATKFYEKHSAYYTQTPYGRLDCRINGFPLKAFATICTPLLSPLIKFGDTVLQRRTVPFRAKHLLVRITSGLAYMKGTCHK